MTTSRILLCLLSVVFAISLVGCSRQAAKEQSQSASPASTLKEQSTVYSAPKEASAGEAASDVSSGLAELSVEDRELAKKQRICPVSGDLLGAMGKPYKTSVKGKTVFLCCQGCEHELKENPNKYLAKLKEAEEKK
jgi:YHS domain-containing protein